MKQFKWILGLALVGLLAVACAGPAPEAPAADAVAEEAAVEEVAEEAMEEEMAEEAMDEEMDEDHADEDHADEAMEEEAMEEESADMAEETAVEEVAEEAAEEAMAKSEVTYVVSTADSAVVWTGAKAVGNSHSGTVDISEGALVVADGALVSGSFVLDMNTISGNPARLVNHLKDDDFFGVATFPTASLDITSAEANGDGTYNVVADLTIKEITNPIEFVATATEDGTSFTAAADIVFDRALYDVQYGSGAFFSGLGDDLINDEVEISVELVASK